MHACIVCMYVLYATVCMYVCMHVCDVLCELYVCMYCMYVCISCMYVCMYCMYPCVCMSVCLYISYKDIYNSGIHRRLQRVCMYVCMYVCMSVCVCVCVCVCQCTESCLISDEWHCSLSSTHFSRSRNGASGSASLAPSLVEAQHAATAGASWGATSAYYHHLHIFRSDR